MTQPKHNFLFSNKPGNALIYRSTLCEIIYGLLPRAIFSTADKYILNYPFQPSINPCEISHSYLCRHESF